MRMSTTPVPGRVVPPADPTGAILLWGLVLILGICVLGLAVWWVRRRLFGASSDDDAAGWSLQHLRDMRARGQIDDHEFETLKAGILDRMKNVAGREERGPPDADLGDRSGGEE